MGITGFLKFMVTNIVVRNLLLMLFVGGAFVYGVLSWLDNYTMHNQAIIVPELKGMQVEEVGPILNQKDLRYQVVDSVFAKGVPPGAIVDQIPHALAKVKKNRIVFLTVNAKTAHVVELPNILEISQRQAVASLRAIGFRVDSITYVDYEYRDLVLKVEYNQREVVAGHKLPHGSSLILEVGNGIKPMPEDSLESNEEIGDTEKRWFE